MSISRIMTGTPWHVEKMVRQEGDSKRHRSRCIYYNKKDGYCSKVVGKCIGSAHCKYYEENCIENNMILQLDECKEGFQGVMMIAMSDIEIDKKFKLPAQEKIDAVIKYYNEYGKMDKPVSVSCYGKKYRLEDKYLRYYVAEKLGLKEIPARISTEKENKLEDRIRVVGTKVIHNKYGSGKVVKAEDKNVVVMFESGKEVTFNIEMCVKNKFLSIG